MPEQEVEHRFRASLQEEQEVGEEGGGKGRIPSVGTILVVGNHGGMLNVPISRHQLGFQLPSPHLLIEALITFSLTPLSCEALTGAWSTFASFCIP